MSEDRRFCVLGISGSLRARSSNLAVLRAAEVLAGAEVDFRICESVGLLPLFNPDLDGEALVRSVGDFRAEVKWADAVVICSPEYAHGVPGALKNALDWVVGSGEFLGKPVLLVNASLESRFAEEGLRETLTVMMAEVLVRRVALGGNRVTVEGILGDEGVCTVLREGLAALRAAVAWVKE